ncbi:MAG: hypothetical protein AABW59_01655, partial [archaeon]
RSETTSRAFIMSIRPRMSQHEGRDAETVEIKQELESGQLETLTVNIVLRQLEKDPSLSIDSIAQTLDTLNNTYKENIKLETILAALKKRGITIEKDRIFARGVKEELDAETKELEKKIAFEKTLKEKEERMKHQKEIKENLELDGIEGIGEVEGADDLQGEKSYEESVELVALQPNVEEDEARKKLAGLRHKKMLGLFGEEEILDRLNMKYSAIYKVKFNYLSNKNAYQVGEAYIDSLRGEFIHDINGKLVESEGLTLFKNMNDTEAVAFRLLDKKMNLESIAKHLKMEKGNAKRVMDALVEQELVAENVVQDKKKEIITYTRKQKADLPHSPLHAIMPSIGKRPITEIESVSLVQGSLSEKEVPHLIKKIWGNVSVKSITHLFLPIWEGVLKKKTGEERIVRIEAINGNMILPKQEKIKSGKKEKREEE